MFLFFKRKKKRKKEGIYNAEGGQSVTSTLVSEYNNSTILFMFNNLELQYDI